MTDLTPDASTDFARLAAAVEPHVHDQPALIVHGAIESVLSCRPPRLLMRNVDGSRCEIEWHDDDTTMAEAQLVHYVPQDQQTPGVPMPGVWDTRDGQDVIVVPVGLLLAYLLQLVAARQLDDGQRAVDEHRTQFETAAYAGHLTHTTVPTPTTVTTAFGRIAVADFSTVVLKRLNDPDQGDPSDNMGRFIVIAHGLDYEGAKPKALWLQLRPLVNPDDPNGWHDRVSGFTAEGIISCDQAERVAAEHLAKMGWLRNPPPGDVAKEQAEARAAVDLVRELIVDGVLTRSASGDWHVPGGMVLDAEDLALDEHGVGLLDGIDDARWDSLDKSDRGPEPADPPTIEPGRTY